MGKTCRCAAPHAGAPWNLPGTRPGSRFATDAYVPIRWERQVKSMGISAVQMVASARARIENLSPDAVAAELQSGSTTLVDLREPEEREAGGSLPGAVQAPRGMLEFYADPTSPYHRPVFNPDARIILMCESGKRSALATETLLRMGYRDVAHLDGGLDAWIAQGLPYDDG